MGKADVEMQLGDAQTKLQNEERNRQEMTAQQKTMEGEVGVIKKDIGDLEHTLMKIEQEKTNRDHTIHTLNDEVAGQDEVINKLNKEKKYIGDNQAKAGEDLQAAEDKVNHWAA